MGSFRPPQGAFQPHEIEILHEAFEAVWETMRAHRPTDNEEELRMAIGDKLCEIAAAGGVSDAASLRSATLANFSFPEA